MSLRHLFINHVAQTSPMALGLEVDRADGMYIYSTDGKAYLDLNSGISVSSLGHRHPKVTDAIKKQVDSHLHTMVYGEHIQRPQVKYADLLSRTLDNGLDTIYFVNCGSEAVETAMKLARKYTGRSEIFSCEQAYHGSTIGAESLRSDEEFTQNFMPAVPGIRHIRFNNEEDLLKISNRTSSVIVEPVQAERGVFPPTNDYLRKLKKRCEEVGALLILDEIQTGFGRTGHLFAFQKYGVKPDVLLIAKGMGGGMPIGAVVSSAEILKTFVQNPILGHLTTFGGHPVCVASALATLEVLLEEDLVTQVLEKEALFHKLLDHELIAEIRSSGLMMAVELTKRKYLKHVVNYLYDHGALVDYFLFNDKSFRLAPPLIIHEKQIEEASTLILKALDYAKAQYV